MHSSWEREGGPGIRNFQEESERPAEKAGRIADGAVPSAHRVPGPMAEAAEGGQSMLKEEGILSEPIRRAIRQRARRARSKDDLVRAVFDGFRSQQIDLKTVSLDAMKAALLEAARAARQQGDGCLPA